MSDKLRSRKPMAVGRAAPLQKLHATSAPKAAALMRRGILNTCHGLPHRMPTIPCRHAEQRHPGFHSGRDDADPKGQRRCD